MSTVVKYLVSISQSAFFTIMTSALDSYKVSHQSDKEKHIPKEVFGNLWGHEAMSSRGECVFHIAMADVDLSAKRLPNEVSPTDGALPIKLDFVDGYFPELEYLGDYHSHPWDKTGVSNELSVERKKLHHQSHNDKLLARFMQNENHPYRIQLITTIFERDNKVLRSDGHIKNENSCIRFQYGAFTIWVKVFVYAIGQRTGVYRKVADKLVALICPSVGIHAGRLDP